jgi:hypothetical protein
VALLLVVSFITAGGAAGLLPGLFAKGSFSALALAGAASLAGGLAIKALSPPPVMSALNPSADTGSADQGKVPASLDGNVLARGANIPRVVGTHQVFPPLACEPLIEVIGGDEYIEAIYILNGPHQFGQIKLGQTDIDSIPDLEWEAIEGRPDDPQITLVTRQSRSDLPQVDLSRPKTDPADGAVLQDTANPENSLPIWHTVSSRIEPDELWGVLAFPEGIVDLSSPGTNMAVPIRVRFRQRGEESWVNLPEIHFNSKSGLPFQKMLVFKWEPKPLSQPAPPTDEGPYLAIKSVPEQTIAPPAPGWEANGYFSLGTGGNVYSAATSATHNVRGVSLYDDRVEVFLDPAIFPRGSYEISQQAGTAYTVSDFAAASYQYVGQNYSLFDYRLSGSAATLPRTRANVHDKVVLARVTSIWHEHPLPRQDFAVIAIRAKNRRVENLSVIASGLIPDWNGSEWTGLVVSSNPAPNLREVWCGGLNADPLPPAIVDDEGLVVWRQACIDNDFTVNAVLEGGSVDDAVKMIASCGFARPVQSETWGVLRDYDRSAETPVQIFSPRNLAGFRWEKAFPKLPDGFRAIFTNADQQYAEDERIVLAAGVDPQQADFLEEVRYVGPVFAADVIARAVFDQAQARSRSSFYYASADIESLVCRRGSLVGLEHDIISRMAGAARIKSVVVDGDDVTGVVLDGTVPAPGRFIPAPGTTLAGLLVSAGPPVSHSDGSFFSDGSGYASTGVKLIARTDGRRQVGNDFFASRGVQPFFRLPWDFLTPNKVGISIRKTDGDIVIRGVVPPDDDSDDMTDITLDAPISDADDLVVPDCQVTTGYVGHEYKRLIVADMRPKNDLLADLVFVDEAPELFGA